MNAASKGEMGPWARNVAEYQLRRKQGIDFTKIEDTQNNNEDIKRTEKYFKDKVNINCM